MRNGILLIDKPAGMTSAGLVAKVKRTLQASRVGHAGTLDPDATGLLVILINGATKVASYAADGNKVYSGTIQLGVQTSTDDLSGEVLKRSDDIPCFADIEREAERLVGIIEQVPPKVSAVKIGGKRAHKLSRQGADFEIEPRTVSIKQFLVLQESPTIIRYRVECSPGTYVRALARDLGNSLGCGGAAGLIRLERSGSLSVDDAISLEQVSWEKLKDWSILIPHVPRIELPQQLARAIHNGQRTALRDAERLSVLAPLMESPGIFLYGAEGVGETMGILAVDEGRRLGFELNLGLKPDSP